MDDRKRIRLRYIVLGYLGGIAITGLAYRYESIKFFFWFAIPWVVLINLFGWIETRKCETLRSVSGCSDSRSGKMVVSAGQGNGVEKGVTED
jgi:hypothetical protein